MQYRLRLVRAALPVSSTCAAHVCVCICREQLVLRGRRSQPSAASGSMRAHAHGCAHAPCAMRCAHVRACGCRVPCPLQNPAKGSIPQLLADMPNIYQTMLENWMRSDTSVSLTWCVCGGGEHAEWAPKRACGTALDQQSTHALPNSETTCHCQWPTAYKFGGSVWWACWSVQLTL